MLAAFFFVITPCIAAGTKTSTSSVSSSSFEISSPPLNPLRMLLLFLE
jgi:hypothetical protein